MGYEAGQSGSMHAATRSLLRQAAVHYVSLINNFVRAVAIDRCCRMMTVCELHQS